jgi:hypothetical protein
MCHSTETENLWNGLRGDRSFRALDQTDVGIALWGFEGDCKGVPNPVLAPDSKTLARIPDKKSVVQRLASLHLAAIGGCHIMTSR